MTAPVPPAVGEYAVEELARLRTDLARFAAALDELAGQADVGAARLVGARLPSSDVVSAGPLLRGVAADVRRIAAPGGRHA